MSSAATSGQSAPAEGYAGDLAPRAAWDMLARDRDCVLVDCRSRPEWSFVGLPDLASLGKKLVLVAWQNWTERGMQPNPEFVREVQAAGVRQDQPVIFLCRSGGRSRSAAIAMTRAGYKHCYNFAGGFEGPHDGQRHRGQSDGWKAAGLPWAQE